MKTIFPKQINGNERKWYVVDAKSKNLGRLASLIATKLSGKDKLDFAKHVDNGAGVIVINCDQFAVTGKKLSDKKYYTHSGFLGGIKETNLQKLLVKKPQRPLELAVAGMLPKNKLRTKMLSRLRLFTGETHNLVAQQPELLDF